MAFFRDLYYDYLCLNLKSYENIGIDLEINKLLLIIFIGLIAACVIISISQSGTALLLRKLMRLDAYNENGAKTLSELGLADHKGICRLITSDNGRISKIIAVVGIKRLSYEEYLDREQKRRDARKLPPEERKARLAELEGDTVDVKNARIYIPEDKRDYAAHVYSSSTGSVLKTVLSCVLLLAFYVVLMLLMPGILSLINSIMGI